MARINVVGNAVIVYSALKFQDLLTLKKYRPDALVLYKGEGSEKEADFAVSAGDFGSLGKYGAEFDGESRDGQGFATITLFIPEGIEDVKEYISDEYGAALLKLNRIEAEIPGVIEEIVAEKARIEAAITIS